MIDNGKKRRKRRAQESHRTAKIVGAIGILLLAIAIVFVPELRIPVIVAGVLAAVVIGIVKSGIGQRLRNHKKRQQDDAIESHDWEDSDTQPIVFAAEIEQQPEELEGATLSPLVARLANETEPFEVSRPSEDSSFLQQILWELRQARLEARAFHEESMQQRERHHILQMDAINRLNAGDEMPNMDEYEFTPNPKYNMTVRDLPRWLAKEFTKAELDDVVVMFQRIHWNASILPILAMSAPIGALAAWFGFGLGLSGAAVLVVLSLIIAFIGFIGFMQYRRKVYVALKDYIVKLEGYLKINRKRNEYWEIITFVSERGFWGKRLGWYHVDFATAVADKGLGVEKFFFAYRSKEQYLRQEMEKAKYRQTLSRVSC